MNIDLTPDQQTEFLKWGQCDALPLAGLTPSQITTATVDRQHVPVLVTPITYSTRGVVWLVTRRSLVL